MKKGAKLAPFRSFYAIYCGYFEMTVAFAVSPLTAFSKLSFSIRLNTMIGSSLSMHIVIEVVSIALRPLEITSI